jgi:hypothetical protein
MSLVSFRDFFRYRFFNALYNAVRANQTLPL